MNWNDKVTVYLGDSITEGYGVSRGSGWVENMKGYICNRGISGDTTAGMRRRFDAHVLEAHPARVVIMGGINDLSEGGTIEQVEENLRWMYDRAHAHGIVVVPAVCVMPDYDELLNNDWAFQLNGLAQLPQKLEQLAEWIREYAVEYDCTCLDFARYFPNYTIDGYHRYFLDGVHPNERGHEIMTKIARSCLFSD